MVQECRDPPPVGLFFFPFPTDIFLQGVGETPSFPAANVCASRFGRLPGSKSFLPLRHQQLSGKKTVINPPHYYQGGRRGVCFFFFCIFLIDPRIPPLVAHIPFSARKFPPFSGG